MELILFLCEAARASNLQLHLVAKICINVCTGMQKRQRTQVAEMTQLQTALDKYLCFSEQELQRCISRLDELHLLLAEAAGQTQYCHAEAPQSSSASSCSTSGKAPSAPAPAPFDFHPHLEDNCCIMQSDECLSSLGCTAYLWSSLPAVLVMYCC